MTSTRISEVANEWRLMQVCVFNLQVCIVERLSRFLFLWHEAAAGLMWRSMCICELCRKDFLCKV